MKKYLILVLAFKICFAQLEPGEVIWEENFDNLDNWIIEKLETVLGAGEMENYNTINLKIFR